MHRFVPLASYRYNPEFVSPDKLMFPPVATNPLEIVRDTTTGYYIYRMTYSDREKQKRTVEGIYGMLELTSHDLEGSSLNLDDPARIRYDHILAHEQTIKPGTELTADDVGTLIGRPGSGPIWAIAMQNSLQIPVQLEHSPLVTVTDTQQVEHRIWQVLDPGLMEHLKSSVESSQLIIADGHHRIARALKKLTNSKAGTVVRLLSFVTNLGALEAEIRPIHRCFKTPLPRDEIINRLSKRYRISEISENIVQRITSEKELIIMHNSKAYALTPLRVNPVDNDAIQSQNIARLLEAKSTQYITDAEKLIFKIKNDPTKVAIAIRPITINQIRRAALSKTPLPPKSTMFYPKPLAGLILGDHINT